MGESQDVILVTGGTGQIGTELMHWLAASAARPLVRVATRDSGSARASLVQALDPDRVQVVPFDADDADSLARALAGVTKLCLVVPYVPDMAAWQETVMAAAQAAGTLRYIVKVSVTGARAPESDPPPGRLPLAHWRGEEAVRHTGIPATMIRPTIFMQHFLTVPGLYRRSDDRFYLPAGAGRIAFLDCRDISAAAATLLLMSDVARAPYEGQAFELTGPAGVTAAEIAAILGWAGERPITHVDGLDAFSAHCRALGVDDGVGYIYREAEGGWFARVEDAAFTGLMGRRPTSFAKFAYDHADHFRAPAL